MSRATQCQWLAQFFNRLLVAVALNGKFPSIANKTCKNKDTNEHLKIENNWLSDKGYTEIIVTRGEKELKPYYKNFKESLAAETI